jgi:hypothetical protein
MIKVALPSYLTQGSQSGERLIGRSDPSDGDLCTAWLVQGGANGARALVSHFQDVILVPDTQEILPSFPLSLKPQHAEIVCFTLLFGSGGKERVTKPIAGSLPSHTHLYFRTRRHGLPGRFDVTRE